MSAFVVIGCVVTAVAVRVSILTGSGARALTLKEVQEDGAAPAYGIEDRAGRPLAAFLERLELEVSPRSMWQGHTPDRMIPSLARVLGESEERIAASFFPDAVDGCIQVDSWPLDERTASRLQDWIEGVAEFERDEARFLPGMWVEKIEGGSYPYRLLWVPTLLLSSQTRSAAGITNRPIAWTRWLADGLDVARHGERELSVAERDKMRSDVWRALIPSGYTKALRDVPADRALALADLLRAEGVREHQVKLVSERERVQPSGSFPVLGRWGFHREEQDQPEAYSGLERLCDKLLAQPEWEFLAGMGGAYTFRRENPVHRRATSYYLSSAPSCEAPVVRSTLDLDLQFFTRRVLEELAAEHDPAVAMAIAIELESGAVLAIDGISKYQSSGFAPLHHAFTPGSTMKLVTMASALEAGVVRPDEMIDVGQGKFVLREGRSSRTISEAEGSAVGLTSAAYCLARSSNAGLTQIGLRLDDDYFHSRLRALGYDQKPDSGLGGEERGRIPSLPWSRLYSQASISFGHEMFTSLWQHAQGLASLVRGGEFKPLKIVSHVRWNSEPFPISQDFPVRAFSSETCNTLRGMMELGAREGTGRHFWRDDIEMGTKTGTAEKVPGELCLHVWGEFMDRCVEQGRVPLSKEQKALRGQRNGHRTCYTSSMAVFGRRRDLPDAPEVFVLVVVDEPRGKEKFGSKVAGPSAMRILDEALGLTRDGLAPGPDPVNGFSLVGAAPLGGWDQPWIRGRN